MSIVYMSCADIHPSYKHLHEVSLIVMVNTMEKVLYRTLSEGPGIGCAVVKLIH